MDLSIGYILHDLLGIVYQLSDLTQESIYIFALDRTQTFGIVLALSRPADAADEVDAVGFLRHPPIIRLLSTYCIFLHRYFGIRKWPRIFANLIDSRMG
jgi:hypothetical protein